MDCKGRALCRWGIDAGRGASSPSSRLEAVFGVDLADVLDDFLHDDLLEEGGFFLEFGDLLDVGEEGLDEVDVAEEVFAEGEPLDGGIDAGDLLVTVVDCDDGVLHGAVEAEFVNAGHDFLERGLKFGDGLFEGDEMVVAVLGGPVAIHKEHPPEGGVFLAALESCMGPLDHGLNNR